MRRPPPVLGGRRDGEFQQVQRRSRVAAGRPHHQREGLVVRLERLGADAALGVVERPPEDGQQLRLAEAPQHEHPRPREQRGVHLERGVLGRRADEDDGARLDVREERVLLRLVEAVNLVDEDDRALAARTARRLGRRHHLLDVLDAREHGAERDETRLRAVRDHARDGRLAGARRPPEDDGLQPIPVDRLAERPAGSEDLLLAHDLVEGAWAHPLGQRAARHRGCRLAIVLEEIRLHGGGGQRRRRWRRASYRTMAVATATFSDSTGAAMGMVSCASACAST
jgi:hypothetical protein